MATEPFGCSIAVCLYFGKKQSDLTYGQANVRLAPTSVGIPKVMDMMEEYKESECRRITLDRRLTGANNIDEQLQEILDYVFRDYIEVWYKEITDDRQFLFELRKVFNRAISNFASRAKEIDWIPFLTQKLVDELATHVKLYRRADQQYQKEKANGEYSEATEGDEASQEYIEKAFFELETKMEENVGREAVSTSEEIEHKYLQEMVEALLFFLLPDEEFDQTMFRLLVREVLVQGVLAPTIEKICDPDYVNQNIIWMCYDSTLTSDAFLTTLKMSNSIEEIQSVLSKVNEEMARTRSKDTGGVDDSSIKQTLSSLSYLKRVCESQIARIAGKSAAGDVVDGMDIPSDMHLKVPSMNDLPFEFILANELGIQYFNDFLISQEKEIYLNMHLDIDYYNKLAFPQLQNTNAEAYTEAAEFALTMIAHFHAKYFSEPIAGLEVDTSCVNPIVKSLEEKKASGTVFDALHDMVIDKLEKYYEDFRRHDLYNKMVRDLDLDNVSSLSEDSCEVSSVTGSLGEPDSERPDTKISATIIQTGKVKEALTGGGKSYAVYSIQVTEISLSGNTEDRQWLTTRRYSDFYDLYVIICDKYHPLRDLPFPGKTTFNKMNAEFLERRANALMEYLQMVLDSETYQLHPSLRKIMSGFLQSDAWEKPKVAAPVKVGAFVNPLRMSVKQKMSKVRAVPDALFGDVIDGFGKMLTKLSIAPTLGKNQLDSYSVGATLDTEDDDNIPMRIMLLLLDEVFDLRKKNQWLRRRIVAILRQIVKATYGDRINRKIVDHVEMLTSSEQVSDFIRQIKEKFWPSGLPAEITPPRDKQTRLRTAAVCKAKMIGSVPDELRHMIGTETTRAGVMRVFTMCQHKRLNKRLIYVILEGVIQTLFPQSQFDKRFRQIHQRSQRGRADSSLSQSDL